MVLISYSYSFFQAIEFDRTIRNSHDNRHSLKFRPVNAFKLFEKHYVDAQTVDISYESTKRNANNTQCFTFCCNENRKKSHYIVLIYTRRPYCFERGCVSLKRIKKKNPLQNKYTWRKKHWKFTSKLFMLFLYDE